jgi:hypothetical protein
LGIEVRVVLDGLFVVVVSARYRADDVLDKSA